jgi:cardiolipin synthase
MARTGTDRIWTVPNVISFLRLLTVPVFAYLLISGQDFAALIVLICATASDFVDGWLARRFDQVTDLGKRMDPASDRLFIAASVFALSLRGLIPIPILAAVLLRDLTLLTIVLFKRIPIRQFPAVTWAGKTGTFLLFVAFPVTVLGEVYKQTLFPLLIVGWVIGFAGAIVYWVAGFGYIKMLLKVKNSPREGVVS